MIKETLNKKLAEAMKAQMVAHISVIKDIKNTFMVYEKGDEKNGPNVLTDEMEVKLLLKLKAQYENELKQYQMIAEDNADSFANQIVEKIKSELEVLVTYIPAQPTDKEIIEFAKKAISTFTNDAGRKVEMRDTKTILAMVQKKYPTASGKIVSQVVKSSL